MNGSRNCASLTTPSGLAVPKYSSVRAKGIVPARALSGR
jgi:hypothetical protein